MLFAVPALAQEQVSVRAGEHRGYTRLVFDWGGPVTYQIDEQATSFTVTFNKAATINTDARGKNVTGLSVLAGDPLKVQVNVPDGAKSRSFPVGARIVVDVYDPPANPNTAEAGKAPDAAQTNQTSVTQAAPAATPASTAATTPPATNTAPAQPSATASTATPAAPATSATPAQPLPSVNSANTPNEKELQEVQDAIKGMQNLVAEVLNNKEIIVSREGGAAAGIPPAGAAGAPANTATGNAAEPAIAPAQTAASSGARTQNTPRKELPAPDVYTLSSTASVGLAAFEDAGRLWMVVDRADTLIKPVASGPNAEELQPVQELKVDGAQAYIGQALPSAFLQGQGGGLLWSVSMSAEVPQAAPAAPKRVDVTKGRDRGGKIVFPFTTARRVLDITDPSTGNVLKVVTVEDAKDFSGPRRDFAEFTVLQSPVGLAILPKVDDLVVEVGKDGVTIARPDGLSLLPEDMVANASGRGDFRARMASQNKDDRRILNFSDWRMGGLDVLNENRTTILSTMGNLTRGTQIENLITLAKMQLANGRGAEALGFLNFAQTEMPELDQNPEFLSLRGVAEAFDWKTDEAFHNLSDPILRDYEEADVWRAFALADLGDWQQAHEILPDDMSMMADYPPEIRNRLGIVLAEIYLRAGERDQAEQVLTLIEQDQDKLNLAHDSALQYLKGEAARQRGKLDETKALWEKLANGTDNLYRVKAGLALTRLKVDQKEMTPAQAIDNLERLRYAWRGDELEAQVSYWLGRTYFENGEYVKGLKIMREAAALVPDTVLGQRINGDMSSIFTDFYTSDKLDKVSPLDAVDLYEAFTDLVPAGEKGNAVMSRLAEHLVKADLLDRAGNLLSQLIDKRLSGDAAAKTATRLAAIQLIDKDAKGALQSLDKADGFLKALPPEVATQARFNELSLLRARAMSLNNQTEQALKLLETVPASDEVNRLRADIAWRNGFWDDAAYALDDVILDENFSLTRPLSDEHAMLILQRAVALNLSGDRIGLANAREKYAEAMSQTNKARLFEVVTRPRKNAGLADRDTLLSTVSEVDLFGEFLDSYKQENAAPSQ